MSRRKRRQRRDFLADFIDNAVCDIYESFCARTSPAFQAQQQYYPEESQYIPPQPRQPQRVQSGNGLGGGFTAYAPPRHVEPAPQQRARRTRIQVSVSMGTSTARSYSRVGRYSDIRLDSDRPGWYAPKAKAGPRRKPPKPSPLPPPIEQAPPEPPPPPPPPPKSEADQLAEELAVRLEAAYTTLRLDPNVATAKDVKKVRRALAMKLHSDRGGGNDELMKEVNAAVDVILENLKGKKAA